MLKKLQNEIKEAMISKNTIKKDVLKMVLNKARAIAKEKKTEDISNEIIIEATKKELKQLKQTINSLSGKEDSSLYKESVKKINILEAEYIPKQMTEDELRTSLEKFIKDNNLRNEGKSAMKTIMPVYKDLADGKMVNKIVSELL